MVNIHDDNACDRHTGPLYQVNLVYTVAHQELTQCIGLLGIMYSHLDGFHGHHTSLAIRTCNSSASGGRVATPTAVNQLEPFRIGFAAQCGKTCAPIPQPTRVL